MHHLSRDADTELATLINAAIQMGTDGTRIVQLARQHGWRPFEDPVTVEVLEGVLANGTHVPIRIYRTVGSHADA